MISFPESEFSVVTSLAPIYLFSFLYFADFENEREPVNAKIYMHGELTWTDFKVMISRSTTPDFVKMITKIQEFFTQQHRNSMRALSTLRPHAPLTSGDMIRSGLALRQSAENPCDQSPAEEDGMSGFTSFLPSLPSFLLCFLVPYFLSFFHFSFFHSVFPWYSIFVPLSLRFRLHIIRLSWKTIVILIETPSLN